MTLCRRKDGDMSRGLLLNKDIWHLSGRRELGTGMRLVMKIGTVGSEGLSGYWDRGRWFLSPIVGTRRMIRGVKVRGGMRERKGRQVGQFEGFLLCTEGSVYGMRGRLFTAISILSVVCRGRRGRLSHVRVIHSRIDWLTHPIKIDFHLPAPMFIPCLFLLFLITVIQLLINSSYSTLFHLS